MANLINLQKMLSTADKYGFGVLACNIRSKYILNGVLEAAFSERAPIILEIAESEAIYCDMMPPKLSELLEEGIARMYEKYGYFVPITLHHDHIQKKVDECVDASIEAGFSSLEVDLSKLPLDENIKRCKEVADKIRPLGISLEVEEGEIGAADALADPEVEKNIENYYTKTEAAVKLAREVRPDAVAFFVGNGHGVYLKTPIIGYQRIKEICDGIREYGAYGVLHGGTGLTPEMFQKAIKAGARKFNYATALSDIWFSYFPEDLLKKMDEKGKELGKARRKVLYLFEKEIDSLDHTQAEIAIAEHLKMMFREAFLNSEKAKHYESF